MKTARLFVTAVTATALSGCAALDTVHYAWPGPGNTDVITTDAKTRNLIMNERTPGDFRVCAEPAPDVFSAFANSFSFGGVFGATSNDVQGANAFASSVATIERTQTINLLRESFFRTCERYLSGAIEQNEFMILAARDHRTMIAVLAIEQMTGVVKPPATIISGPAVQSSISQSEELLALLKLYVDERVAAEKAYVDAKEAYDAVNVLFTPAAPVPAPTPTPSPAPSGTPSPTPSPTPAATPKPLCKETQAPAGKQTEFSKCAPAKERVDAAKALFDATSSRENQVLSQLAALSGGIGAATSAGTTNVGGLPATGERVSDFQMAIIARSVERIALTAGIDEALMFCMGYLREQSELRNSTHEMCNQIIAQRALQDSRTTASIAGASEVQSVIQLAQDPEGQGRADLLFAQYQVFKFDLLFALTGTEESQWNERWTAFVQATSIPASTCTSLTACREFVSAQDTSPFLFEFQTRADAMSAAAKAWRAAIRENSEIGQSSN